MVYVEMTITVTGVTKSTASDVIICYHFLLYVIILVLLIKS